MASSPAATSSNLMWQIGSPGRGEPILVTWLLMTPLVTSPKNLAGTSASALITATCMPSATARRSSSGRPVGDTAMSSVTCSERKTSSASDSRSAWPSAAKNNGW